MRQFTLNIPDDKIAFFTQLFEQLSVTYEQTEFEIPKWQQDIVTQRIKTAKPNDYKDWDGINDELSF